MKKYLYTTIIALAVLFLSLKTNTWDKEKQINEMLLMNIECLATPEDSNVSCYFSGSVDCPKNDNQVMFYI